MTFAKWRDLLERRGTGAPRRTNRSARPPHYLVARTRVHSTARLQCAHGGKVSPTLKAISFPLHPGFQMPEVGHGRPVYVGRDVVVTISHLPSGTRAEGVGHPCKGNPDAFSASRTQLDTPSGVDSGGLPVTPIHHHGERRLYSGDRTQGRAHGDRQAGDGSGHSRYCRSAQRDCRSRRANRLPDDPTCDQAVLRDTAEAVGPELDQTGRADRRRSVRNIARPSSRWLYRQTYSFKYPWSHFGETA